MGKFRRELAFDHESHHFSLNVFILFETTIAEICFELNVLWSVVLKNEMLKVLFLISFRYKLSSIYLKIVFVGIIRQEIDLLENLKWFFQLNKCSSDVVHLAI